MLQKGEGRTNRELAEALEITQKTVKSRISRARVRLREELLALAKTNSTALQS